MSLFSRTQELPGLHGALRDCTPGGNGMKKFRSGDIAVINAANISRQEAQALIDVEPAAVVNVAEFSTGAIPNYGPHMLLDAQVLLLENVGEDFIAGFRDGKKARITEQGEIFAGDNLLAHGTQVERAKAEKDFADARRNLVDRMEAYFGNSIEFIHSEGPLLIDGLGIPESGAEMKGRKVVVVSPSDDHRTQIKGLRNFIREYEPVIVGVDAGADSLLALGYTPDLIVGNPEDIDTDTLRSGARVILPADPDGTAEGLERIQDLGIGAMTFPAATDSATDLALLLADYHGAEMIVQVGDSLDLDDIFAAEPNATPAAMLTRLKAGNRLVDSSAIINLYTVKTGSSSTWLWAILGILVALAAIVLIIGMGGDGTFTDNLIDTWNNIATTVQGWF
jgi:uncharacterized membrane-anchored protein